MELWRHSYGVTAMASQRPVLLSYTLLVTCSIELPENALPPESETVYEWTFDQEEMRWVDWMDTAPEYKCNPDMPFADIMVPTPDTVRYTFVMRHLILSGHHVLAVGGTGTGKTLAVQVCIDLMVLLS